MVNDFMTSRGVRSVLTALVIACSGVLFSWQVEAQEILRKGHFTVRKVDGVCKLEITMSMVDREGSTSSNRDPVAILALFADPDFYGELFTERRRVGMARKEVLIGFDMDPDMKTPFVETPGKDRHWRWQYLETPRNILDDVANRNAIRVAFHNGNQWWRFKVSLKGTARIVRRLKSCR